MCASALVEKKSSDTSRRFARARKGFFFYDSDKRAVGMPRFAHVACRCKTAKYAGIHKGGLTVRRIPSWISLKRINFNKIHNKF